MANTREVGYADDEHMFIDFGIPLILVASSTLAAAYYFMEEAKSTPKVFCVLTMAIALVEIAKSYYRNFDAERPQQLVALYRENNRFVLFNDSSSVTKAFSWSAIETAILTYAIYEFLTASASLNLIVTGLLINHCFNSLVDDMQERFGARRHA